MKARREFRRRGEVEVEVLDALVDRREEGMTVFELRASVDADIEAIETALSGLKEDDLITITRNGGSLVIKPDDRVLPEPGDDTQPRSLFDWLREWLRF